MEKLAMLLIPVLLAFFLLRSLLTPVKLGFRAALHGICGFLCLWILNLSSAVTGVYLPVNPVTVLLSGVLGLPGVALVALLTLV